MGFGDSNNGQHTWTLPEDRSREVIRSALDAGVTFFDTAVGYQNGTSESYLGRALRDFADRDSVIVATKFLPRTQAEIDAGVGGREHVLRSLDTSLVNLGMDHVDLLIYHMWDYRTPLAEIMQGLKEAMDSGKALHIGISNCFAWQLCRANALADAMDMERFVSVQNHYNLIFREEEREMAKLCREDNIAMTGETTLRGRVLPVGGIKEKILAAKRAGIREIILSEENRKDISEIKPEYLEGLTFHYVRTNSDVLKLAMAD